jgi:hypothetical protein
MKKFIFLFILFPLGNIFSQNFTADNVKNYAGKTYHIALLLGVIEVQLNPDNTYTAKYESEGVYWYNSGKYRVEKGLMRLTPSVCKQFGDTNEEVDCSSTLGEAKVDLIKDDYSLYYKEYLFFESRYNKQLLMEGKENDNFLLPVPGTEVPPGETRMISRWQVVTMGMKKTFTTTFTKIRKTPEESGEEVAYYPAIFEPEQKSVPKNATVTLVARTMEKYTVNNKEDYWYFINVGACDGVWIWGGCVKIN